MPVDNTKHPSSSSSSSRRTQRKLTEEELKDIEQKRLRGELSCAECRRLKLRCDKKVPCGSCYRRGCESICPLGVLAAGQGTRFILADTDQLHEKIHHMSNRIRQLEDALEILQSSISDQRHPLLSEELLRIKFGSEAIRSKKDLSGGDGNAKGKKRKGAGRKGGRMLRGMSVVEEEEEDGVVREEEEEEEEWDGEVNEGVRIFDTLGTLTLGSSGEMRYFGRSGGSETLMMKADGYSDDSDNPEHPVQPIELANLANLFPFTSKNRPNVSELELVESFLPTLERAAQLAECYLRHGSYFFRPVKREELVDVLMKDLYEGAEKRKGRRFEEAEGDEEAETFSSASRSRSPSSSRSRSSTIDPSTPHQLATLFFIFALGALLDLKKKPYNAEAERYYDLGRAALSLRPVYDSPSMDTVKAMGLMATYHSLAGKKYSRDSAWCVMSSAAKLAQSLGLHRDSARWNMDPEMVQKRRNLFWEVLSADVSHSLALGRPPTIHLSYVDCEFPLDTDPSLGSPPTSDINIEKPTGFWHMKHLFARDIYYSVADLTLIAKSPSYSTILELDKKVRELEFPRGFNPFGRKEEVGEDVYRDSEATLRDFYASQHRGVTMLYIHRSFFAQAMLEHPTNPLLSPYAPSFLTAYRTASMVIKATQHMFERCKEIGMRLWFLLGHTFSSAVIAGTVVTRSPNSSISLLAMKDFELVLGLFEKTAEQSQRARVALDVLLKLREKAKLMYAQIEERERERIATGGGASSASTPSSSNPSGAGGGKPKHVETKFIFEPTSPVQPLAIPTLERDRSGERSKTKGMGSREMDVDMDSQGHHEDSPGEVKLKSKLKEEVDDIEDDLAIFGGQTRMLEKSASASSGYVESPSPSASANTGGVARKRTTSGGGKGKEKEREKERETSTFMDSLLTSPPPPGAEESGNVNLDLNVNEETTPFWISYSNYPPPQPQYMDPPTYGNLLQQQQQQPLMSMPPTTTTNVPLQQIVAQDNYSDVLPEIHPTALTYLNQEAVKRVQFVQHQSSLAAAWGGYAPAVPAYGYTQQQQAFGLYSATDNARGGGGRGNMDSAGVVEIGLASESGMDQNWMSFMRDCGIMSSSSSTSMMDTSEES